MFEYLRGIVHILQGDAIVIDIQGMGYKIHVPNSTKDILKEGDETEIYVYLSVREDAMKLYGFANRADRDMFEKLLTVSGIGPALSLNILSHASTTELYQAIYEENISFFRRIKGIGPKTASRLVLELKGNLLKLETQMPKNSFRNDAINALMGLGYSELDASEAVQKAFQNKGNFKNLEELVIESLAQLR